MDDFKAPHPEKCAKVFKEADKDGSGFIEQSEVSNMFKLLNVTMAQDEIDIVLKVVDTNNDGKLQLQEFIHLVYICQNSTAGNLNRIMFLAADRNYSKSIDADEMYTIFKKLGAESTREEIELVAAEAADLEGKQLSYRAYCKVLRTVLGEQ